MGALGVMTNAGNHEGCPYKHLTDHATSGRTEMLSQISRHSPLRHSGEGRNPGVVGQLSQGPPTNLGQVPELRKPGTDR